MNPGSAARFSLAVRDIMTNQTLHQRTFLLLLILVSIAFGWILMPFFSPVFWSVVLAIVFAPLHRRLLARMHQRQNLAAITAVLLCLVMVIIPVTLLIMSLMQEGMGFYQKIRAGEVDFGAYFQQIIGASPSWLQSMLERSGITDIATLQEKLTSGAAQGSQFIASRAFQIGQNIFGFLLNLCIMLYLLFFFFRDGAELSDKVVRMIPLSARHKQTLLKKMTTVIRATVKGNIVVAAIQGALGGIIFWVLGIQGAILWGVLMAFLSLLPAIGAGIVWVPVALYFLATGLILKGLILIGFGTFVIGLIDNLLRPVLVGKDTRLPDYVVFISTIGGLELFGLNGFVIGPIIAAIFISIWEIFYATTDETPKDEIQT